MARHNQGYVRALAGDLPAALNSMRAADAMDVDVSRSVARLDHGRVLLEAGLLDEAREMIESALAVSLDDGQRQIAAEIEMEAGRERTSYSVGSSLQPGWPERRWQGLTREMLTYGWLAASCCCCRSSPKTCAAASTHENRGASRGGNCCRRDRRGGSRQCSRPRRAPLGGAPLVGGRPDRLGRGRICGKRLR